MRSVSLQTPVEYLYSCPIYGDTDYTGRWKINRTNDRSELFIECFDLEDVEFRGTGTKIRANVRWVSEDKLLVLETEEFINTCGGSNA